MDSSDISVLLQRIKDAIKVVEAGSRDSDVLVAIEQDYLEMLELIKLFLISERDSYYGYFLMNMRFRANFTSNGIAGILLNTFPPVFEANPLLLCSYALKEVIYIVCHEVDHVVFNHPAEMLRSNPDKNPATFRRFNIAADASVNDRLNYEVRRGAKRFMREPEGLVTSETVKRILQSPDVVAMESYKYYFDLLEDHEDQLGDSAPQSGDSRDDADSGDERSGNEDSSGGADANDVAGSEDGQTQGEVVTWGNRCGEDDHNWALDGDAEDAEYVARELVNRAVDAMGAETRGRMPGYFSQQVERFNRPAVISWQSLLKRYVGTINAGKRKTRSRLNRRQPTRFDLSGTFDEKILEIVIAIDTSASVTDTDLRGIFNEVFAILAHRKYRLTIIECDAQIQKVYQAQGPNDVQLMVAGRGGTAFTPVIAYLNEHRQYRNALLIFFTDGFGERKIPRPMIYRTLWVILGNKKNLSVEEPYGAVTTLKGSDE